MDGPRKISPGERCPEHNLAFGPTGACVLCRREQPGQVARARGWWSPVLLVAGLGTAPLGGVALGRRHAPPPPVVEATAAEAVPVPPVEAPIEETPVAVVAQPRPREIPAPAVPAPAPTPPPRDYLGEAYAAMPKGDLYDAPAHPAPVQPSVTASAPPPPRPHLGMGRHGHGGGRH
jgi:hypothetical protein